jgi:hypothetical protein
LRKKAKEKYAIMALHPDFPISPYGPLIPEQRWFPAAEDLRDENGTRYEFIYVDQESFEKHKPTSLAGLEKSFNEYKP